MILSEDYDLFPTAAIGNLKPTFTAGRQSRHVGVEHEISKIVWEVKDWRTAVLILFHLEATNVRGQQGLAGVEERVGWVGGRADHGRNKSHPGLGRSHHGHWGAQRRSDWS